MKQNKKIRFPIWAEMILVIALVVAFVAIRIYLLDRNGCEIQGGISFFEAAQVSGTALPPLGLQNLSVSGVYTYLLHFVLSFFGNRQDAAIWFQNAVYLLGMILFYFAIRIAVGNVLAIPFLAVAALLPTFVFGGDHIRVLEPCVLVWTAIGIALFVLAVIYRLVRGAIKKRRKAIPVSSSEEAAQSVVSRSEETVQNSWEESEPKPRKRTDPIPNPLPGPKKHVKRELDFDIEPEENRLEFDHKISENDDFDL